MERPSCSHGRPVRGAGSPLGWLLWAGGLVGLWTVGSLVETIRDVLRRAYGTPATQAFWPVWQWGWSS